MNPLITFGLSLLLLIIASNILIISLKRFSSRFNLSNFFVGLLIASVATSLPEIFNSINAGLKNAGDIGLGNIVGANLINLTLNFGIFGLLTAINLKRKSLKMNSFFLIISPLALFFALFDGKISFFEGFVLCLIYLAYLFQLFLLQPKAKDKISSPAQKNKKETALILSLFIFGTILLFIASKLVVDSAITSSRALGLSGYTLSFFVIALATTLPELTFSITSAFKNATDLGLGNIIGSNIANPLLAIGLGSIFRSYSVSYSLVAFDILFLLLVTSFFVFLSYFSKTFDRKQAAGFILIYFTYLTFKIFLF